MFSGETCRTCKYFRPTPEDIDPSNLSGFCCLQPDAKAKKNIEWCGQFRKSSSYLRLAFGAGSSAGAWNMKLFGTRLFLLARIEQEGAPRQIKGVIDHGNRYSRTTKEATASA